MERSSKYIAGASAVAGTLALSLFTLPRVFSGKESNSLNSSTTSYSPEESQHLNPSVSQSNPQPEFENFSNPLTGVNAPKSLANREFLLILSNQSNLLPDDYQRIFGLLNSWISTSSGAISVRKAEDGKFVIARAEVTNLVYHTGNKKILTPVLKIGIFESQNTEAPEVTAILQQLADSPETSASFFAENEGKLKLAEGRVENLPSEFTFKLNEYDGSYRLYSKSWSYDRGVDSENHPLPRFVRYNDDKTYFEQFKVGDVESLMGQLTGENGKLLHRYYGKLQNGRITITRAEQINK